MEQLLHAQEELTCRLLLDYAKSFFADPENLLRFEAWQRQRAERDQNQSQQRERPSRCAPCWAKEKGDT
ncbi:MAG: hypothetical protein MR590_04830 [Clostridiales bacterium]|nr:hypothetical protein [Clostridiales bacterium]